MNNQSIVIYGRRYYFQQASSFKIILGPDFPEGDEAFAIICCITICLVEQAEKSKPRSASDLFSNRDQLVEYWSLNLQFAAIARL